MAKQDYSEKFKGFADKVKTEKVEIPMQKVVPVKKAQKRVVLDKENETPFNVWTTKDNIKYLKQIAIEEDSTIRDLINEGINMVLAERKKKYPFLNK